MPSWFIKASIQGLLSLTPQPERLNYYFQRYVSKRLQVSNLYIQQKCTYANNYIQFYYNSYQQLPQRVLELGTGWLPIVPIALAICNVPEILAIDIKPLITAETLHDTLVSMKLMLERNELDKILPFLASDALYRLENALEVFAQDQDIIETMKSLNIQVVYTDARTITTTEFGQFNLITSLNTFEHIPPHILADILTTQSNLLTDDGIIHNHIDLSDHYSHFDKSITPYHFLRHNSFIWKLVNNTLQYQNRLRISDYRNLYTQAGFDIIFEKTTVGSKEQIAEIRLAPNFKSYSHENIIVITAELIGKSVKSI